jgi:hypothetical protein
MSTASASRVEAAANEASKQRSFHGLTAPSVAGAGVTAATERWVH